MRAWLFCVTVLCASGWLSLFNEAARGESYWGNQIRALIAKEGE